MAEERAQRRLAAILAADVVGYSRMMGVNEAGTLTALKAWQKDIIQPLMTKHIGRVVKLMGDGVLAEFASAVNAESIGTKHDLVLRPFTALAARPGCCTFGRLLG